MLCGISPILMTQELWFAKILQVIEFIYLFMYVFIHAFEICRVRNSKALKGFTVKRSVPHPCSLATQLSSLEAVTVLFI